jgi:RsiW-degrading membrane proteinase PrsW (M82 family)
MILIKIAVSISPVLAFLVLLIVLDSFRLLRLSLILATIGVGCCIALLALALNRWALSLGLQGVDAYARSVGPVLEESLKALVIVYFIRARRVGFTVDAAILGFTVGAGFALVENIHYMHSLEGAHIGVWIIRGFGTAVMHGGTTSIFAILSKTVAEKRGSEAAHVFLPGFAAATGIHVLFNQFLLPPMVNTALQLIGLPVLMAVTFARSEQALRDWLEVGLDTDVSMLDSVTAGAVSETKAGKYLLSLKSRFPGSVVGDMLCMLRIHLELAIRAKGILMMREVGFKPPPDPEIRGRFKELRFLEKSIGRTGMLAIAPILHNSSRDLWQIYMLDRG